jgi:hypothetical protein
VGFCNFTIQKNSGILSTIQWDLSTQAQSRCCERARGMRIDVCADTCGAFAPRSNARMMSARMMSEKEKIIPKKGLGSSFFSFFFFFFSFLTAFTSRLRRHASAKTYTGKSHEQRQQKPSKTKTKTKTNKKQKTGGDTQLQNFFSFFFFFFFFVGVQDRDVIEAEVCWE